MGVVTYLNTAQTPMDGIMVRLVDVSGFALDSVQTDQDGYFTFYDVQDGNYFIRPAVSKPVGGITSIDALLIMKHFVGMNFLSGLPRKAADVDLNLNINATDALLTMRRFVNLITTFPAGDWLCDEDTLFVSGQGFVFVPVSALCFGDVNGTYEPPPCAPYPSVANAGPDQSAVQGAQAVLAANMPVSGTGRWTNITAYWGVFSDPASPVSVFSGIPGLSYSLVWTVSTPCFSTRDTVVIGFAPVTAHPCPGIDSLLYGGKTYHTVLIGCQCWLKENLDIGARINGSLIMSNNGIIEKYCFNNSDSLCNVYGGLYQWGEMVQYYNGASNLTSWNPPPAGTVRGICPAGWHLPTHDDFVQLMNVLGGWDVAGGKMKEAGTIHWMSPNAGATNESQFTALGGGYLENDTSQQFSGFRFLMGIGRFWTCSELGAGVGWLRTLLSDQAFIGTLNRSKSYGYSVRCLKD